MDYPNKNTRPRIMDILEAEQASDVSLGAPASQPGERPRIMNLLEDSLKPKDRTLLSTAGDVAVTGAKALVGMGESLVGLADLIPGITPSGRPSYGLAGKALESLGWDPKKTHAILETLYSPKQQAANLRVQQAEGFVNSVKESIKNPSTILHSTLESLPIMFGGAGIARFGLSKAPLLLKTYPQLAPLVAGAMGEGLVSMGMAAEQNRQETPDGYLTAKQAAINVASGFGTGAIALAGGRLAMKLGISDVDTLLAGGRFNVGSKGIIKRILGGGLSEGAFEELPQSMQEQMWANAALDRPLMQGVGEAGAQGMLAGALMGAGAGITPGKPDLKKVIDQKKKKPFSPNLQDQLNTWSKSKETDPLGDDDVARDIIETLGAPLTQPPEIAPDEAGGAPDIAQLSAFEALKLMLQGKEGRIAKPKYKWRTNKEPAAGDEPFMILGDNEDPSASITKHPGVMGNSIYNAFVRTDAGLESIGLFSTLRQATTFAQDELEAQNQFVQPQADQGTMQPQTNEFAEPLAAFAAGLEGEPQAPEVPPAEAPPKIPPTVDELRAEKERRIDKYRQRKASNATTLRSFLNAMGGVNINDPVFKGEFEGIRWDVSEKGKKVLAKGFPRGFWNKKGRTLDTLVTDAIEAGWLPARSTDEDLLNAVANDLRIKHTHVEATIQPQVDEREKRLVAELEDEARAAEPPPPLEEHPPEVTPDFDTLVKKAQAWKGATLAADRLYDKEDKKARLNHSRMTTKGDLDTFLMKEYDLDAVTARSVSNQLTRDNLLPDENINLENYKGEPWADAAFNYKKPEPEYQPRSGVKAWRDLETGDVFFDEMNNRHLQVLAKRMDRKANAIALAESKGGEVWIDHNNTWAVVAVAKPGTPSHDLAFMKQHKTKEQLDKKYQYYVKQIEGNMEPDQARRARMMSDLKSAYKIESEKYPKTDKTGLPQTNDGRLFVSGLNNKQLASLAQSAGFSKERIGRLDLESHRSRLVVAIQELEDKGLLDSSVIGGKQATKPAKAAQDKQPWQMKLEEFEKAGYRPADVTMSQWVNIMRNHRRDIGQSTKSGTPASPYADYEEYWKRDVEEAKPKKPEEATPKQEYDYSNTQINLPAEAANAIKAYGENIPDDELYIDPEDPSSGRELEPHVTVRYGIDTANVSDVSPAFEGLAPITVKMGKVSIFHPSEKYDVVKIDIESPDLQAANKRVGETVALPGETFTDYKPHATIAYVKKGEGQKYVRDTFLEGREFTIDTVTFSSKNGKSYEIPLTGKPTPAEPKKPEEAPKADVKTAIARDIEAAKAKLIKQANRKGISETFGQKEVRDLEDKHGLVALMLYGTPEEREMGETINDFRDWTENYTGEPKKPDKSKVLIVDDWRKNIIKARDYAIRLGIKAEKGIGDHWTDLEALVKGIDNYLTPSKAPAQKKGIAQQWDEANKEGRYEILKGTVLADQSEYLSQLTWKSLSDRNHEDIIRELKSKPLTEPKPKKASEMTAAEMMAEWDKQVSEQAEASIKPVTPVTGPPTAKQKAEEAKQHLKNAADKFKQINKILGDIGAIGKELDEGVWSQIKPLLQEAFSEILAAGKSGAEFVSLSIQNLSPKGRPYFEKFVNEEMKAKETKAGLQYYKAQDLAKEGFTSWDSKQGYDTDEEAAKYLDHWERKHPDVDFRLSKQEGGANFPEKRTVSVWGKSKVTEVTEGTAPWALTQDQYMAGGEFFDSPNILTPAKHEALVLKAYQAGKPVPANVLADYPDMVQELAWIETLIGGKAAPVLETAQDFKDRIRGITNEIEGLQAKKDVLQKRAIKLAPYSAQRERLTADGQEITKTLNALRKELRGYQEGLAKLAKEPEQKKPLPKSELPGPPTAESNVDKSLRAGGALNKHFYLDDVVDYLADQANKGEPFIKFVKGKQTIVPIRTAGNAIMKMDGMRTYTPAAFEDFYNKLPEWIRLTGEAWLRRKGIDPDATVAKEPEPSTPVEPKPLSPEKIEGATNEATIAETKDLMMTELMAHGDTAVYKALAASLKVLEAQGKPISEVKAPETKEKVSRETSRPGSPEQLKNIKVDRTLVDENGDRIMTKDGKVFTQPETAFEAFNDIDSRLDIYKELLDCIRG